jgi:hypothetical protein
VGYLSWKGSCDRRQTLSHLYNLIPLYCHSLRGINMYANHFSYHARPYVHCTILILSVHISLTILDVQTALPSPSSFKRRRSFATTITIPVVPTSSSSKLNPRRSQPHRRLPSRAFHRLLMTNPPPHSALLCSTPLNSHLQRNLTAHLPSPTLFSVDSQYRIRKPSLL